ncbi:unnamed protein product [Haemonchus placei]|uniref:SCP domain-containing protein n=1 Tax=Haemonchus placei TaxID=6290 RepID=A0A0N4WRD4_HAEPC|nr:unnamed protein product [Haemonchus placei]
MLLFLPLAFLLFRGCNGQLGNTKSMTAQAVQLINEYRQTVANGSAFDMSGNLPSTLSMFQLKGDDTLSLMALTTVFSCNVSNPKVQPGYSFNGYSISYLPSSMDPTTILEIALAQWEQEPLLYGIGDNVVYSNTKLKEWANMVYYKSTKVGCYYNLCNTTGPTTQAIACLFNMVSRLAQGLVPNGTTGKNLPQGTDIAQMLYNQTLEHAAQDYANTCPKGLSPVSSREGTGEIYQSLPSNTLALMDVIEAALKASWHPIMVHGFDPSLEFTDLTPHLANAPLMFTQVSLNPNEIANVRCHTVTFPTALVWAP